MFGRLARWLRVLGWDAEYSKGTEFQRLIKKAGEENRILLTRRQGVEHDKLVFVNSEILEEQLKQLEASHKVISNARPFTRCIECNAELCKIAKTEARGKVPFFTFETEEEFYRCPSCGKIFWRGSHYKTMFERLEKFSHSTQA